MRLLPAYGDTRGVLKLDNDQDQSPDIALRIMKIMMSGVVHPHDVANGLEGFQNTPSKKYKTILFDQLNHHGMYCEIEKMKVMYAGSKNQTSWPNYFCLNRDSG